MYMINLIEASLNKQVDKKNIDKKEFKLPVIVPIVLYNGEPKWEVSLSFKDKLQQADLFGNHVINFKINEYQAIYM